MGNFILFKRNFYHFLFLFIFLLLNQINIKAEGSVDFIGYPGYRLFLDVERKPQFKVYANANEYINVGASHLGYSPIPSQNLGGSIKVWRPDGTLHIEFKATSTTSTIGIIDNYLQEVNGPTGGGSTNGSGYVPGVVKVDPGQEGIWTVTFEYPSYTGSNFNSYNLLNNAPWTKATNQPLNKRVVLAWDITITKNNAGNEGGSPVKGRVFTNEFSTIVSESDSATTKSTSPKYYVLSKDGIQYKIDFNETKPWGFPVTSSNLGLVNKSQEPCYCAAFDTSYIRSSDPSQWNNTSKLYYYEPQAKDIGNLINNKIFINIPDPAMPATALVTDIFRNEMYQTWLYHIPLSSKPSFDLDQFKFTSGNPAYICNNDTTIVGLGGYLKFISDAAGSSTLKIDINRDGDYNDPVDRKIFKYISSGTDSIFWDGKDGLGNNVPASNSFDFKFSIDLKYGEIHMMLYDIENNPGQVVFTRLNGANSPSNSVYYDFSKVNGPVSGGGSPGDPLESTTTYTYNDIWGNRIMQDYFSFLDFKDVASGLIKITIVDTCLKLCAVDLVKPTIQAISPVCSNDSIRLVVGSPYPGLVDTITGAEYKWTNGNNQSIITTTNRLTFAANSAFAVAPYKVQVALSPDCISPLSDEKYITINNPPTAIADNNGPVCVGGMVDLIATNVSGGSYEWTLLNNSTVISTDRIYMLSNVTSSNIYQLRVSVPGCTFIATDTTYVEIVPKAIAHIQLQGNNSKLCGPGLVTLTADLQTNGTYEWRVLGTSTVISNSPNFTTTVDKTTSFELTVRNPVCTEPAKDTVKVTVTDIPIAVAGNDANDKLCSPGVVQLFANYVDNAIYEWRLQGSTTVISTQQNPIILVNSSSVFELVIKIDGCVSNTATTSINVNTKPTLTNIVGDMSVCEGDSVHLQVNFLNDVNGSYVISGADISTGLTSINGKTINFIITKSKLSNAGLYSLQLTTTDNCNYNYDSLFNLFVNPIPVAVASNGGRVCKGDTGFLFANTIANANYEWRIKGNSNLYSIDQNPKVFNVDSSTTYELIIEKNGCRSMPSYTTLEAFPIPQIEILADTIKVCEGQTIDLKATINAPNYQGNIRYNWSGPNNYSFSGLTKSGVQTSTLITNSTLLNKGTYTINAEFEEIPNCGASPKSIYVDVIPRIKLTILGNDQCCFGDTFKLRVVPANLTNYVWMNGNGVVIATNVTNINLPSNSPLAVSPIKVIADNQSCRCEGELPIQIIKLPVIAASNDGPICQGDSVTLTADLVTNATYEWRIQGNSTIISTKNTFNYPNLLQTTTFVVTVRLPNCNQVVSASTTVIVNLGPEVSNLTGDGNYCLGTNVTLNATGGVGTGNVTYIWVFLPTQQPVFIGVAPKSGPFPLQINNIQLTDAGTYLLVVQDLLTGCTTIGGTVNVLVKDLPVKPVITAIDDTVCVGQSLILNCTNYTGNVKYQWFRNDTLIGTTSVNSFTISNMTIGQRGLYSVIVMVDGCTSEKSDAIFIEVFGQGMPFTITNPTSADNPACQGNSLTVNAMPMNGASYMWFGPNGMIPNASGPTLILSPVTKSTEGLYYVKIVKNECATVYSDTIFIHVSDKPIANGDNYTVEYNSDHTGNVLLNDVLGNNKSVNMKIVTTPKNGTVTISYPNLIYTPNNNFIGNDFLVYEICSKVCPNDCDTAIVNYIINGPLDCDPIPNIITPDGDNLNDTWVIPCLVNYPTNNLTIFNRWGDKVFEQTGYSGNWKGTYNDTPLPAGTYFYILKLKPEDSKLYSGYVSIVR